MTTPVMYPLKPGRQYRERVSKCPVSFFFTCRLKDPSQWRELLHKFHYSNMYRLLWVSRLLRGLTNIVENNDKSLMVEMVLGYEAELWWRCSDEGDYIRGMDPQKCKEICSCRLQRLVFLGRPMQLLKDNLHAMIHGTFPTIYEVEADSSLFLMVRPDSKELIRDPIQQMAIRWNKYVQIKPTAGAPTRLDKLPAPPTAGGNEIHLSYMLHVQLAPAGSVLDTHYVPGAAYALYERIYAKMRVANLPPPVGKYLKLQWQREVHPSSMPEVRNCTQNILVMCPVEKEENVIKLSRMGLLTGMIGPAPLHMKKSLEEIDLKLEEMDVIFGTDWAATVDQ